MAGTQSRVGFEQEWLCLRELRWGHAVARLRRGPWKGLETGPA